MERPNWTNNVRATSEHKTDLTKPNKLCCDRRLDKVDRELCICYKCYQTNKKCLEIFKVAYNDIQIYANNLTLFNLFYCKTERNITFKNKRILEESLVTLEELEIDIANMNVPKYMNNALVKYATMFKCKSCIRIVNQIFKLWTKQIFNNLYVSMCNLRKKLRNEALDECYKKCITKTPLYNLTNLKISKREKKFLENGLNFVPTITKNEYTFRQELEQTFKSCLVGLYKGVTGDNITTEIYPTNVNKLSLIETLGLLYIQPKFTNEMEKMMLSSIDLFLSTKNLYVQQLLKTQRLVNDDSKKKFKLNFRGGFVSIADKGVAIVILPHSWYQLQFAKMLENNSYSLIGLNEIRCIEWIKNKIDAFKQSLDKNENWLFKQHFKWDVKDPKIACIKLLAKLHKLKNEPTFKDVHDIPSRVVRGGESCPLNPYSCVLQKLVTEMINDLKLQFTEITKTKLKFPLINGCEQFREHVDGVNLNLGNFFTTVLITSDFKDAFTNLGIDHLINAIEIASDWLKYSKARRNLIIKLAKLVIPNCTFITPNGIILSRSGLPIGGHSSAECLNFTLLVNEIDIIMNLGKLADNILSFCRLVDDCSLIVKGNFGEIVKIIKKMADGYPDIELNMQLSPRFSSFLDYKLYNMFPGNSKIITAMQRKPLHSYNYIKPSSNCPENHKGCVITSTLHRIFRRCNTASDRVNEVTYTRAIMKSRGYGNDVFDEKLRKFLMPKTKNITDHTKRIKSKVAFDGKTMVHEFICKVLERTRNHFGLKKPYIVPGKKVKDFIRTKRQIISDVAVKDNRPDPICRKRKGCPEVCKLCDIIKEKRSKLSHTETTFYVTLKS